MIDDLSIGWIIGALGHWIIIGTLDHSLDHLDSARDVVASIPPIVDSPNKCFDGLNDDPMHQ
jgi:hypothetical protein